MIRIISFNTLAPCFTNPSYYPNSSNPYLEWNNRLSRLLSFLYGIKSHCDIIALQEVTQDIKRKDLSSFDYFNDILESEFEGKFYPHEMKYWNEWIDPHVGYIPNGNALFLRRSLFSDINWSNLALSSGNHVVQADARINENNIRIMSLHLDGDNPDKRIREYTSLLQNLPSGQYIGSIDIMLGDFNAGDSQLYKIMNDAGFTDLVQLDHSTFSISYDDRTKSPIDHITCRSYKDLHVINNQILGKDIWENIPSQVEFNLEMETKRLNLCLQRFGSDHFPIMATLLLI